MKVVQIIFVLTIANVSNTNQGSRRANSIKANGSKRSKAEYFSALPSIKSFGLSSSGCVLIGRDQPAATRRCTRGHPGHRALERCAVPERVVPPSRTE